MNDTMRLIWAVCGAVTTGMQAIGLLGVLYFGGLLLWRFSEGVAMAWEARKDRRSDDL